MADPKKTRNSGNDQRNDIYLAIGNAVRYLDRMGGDPFRSNLDGDSDAYYEYLIDDYETGWADDSIREIIKDRIFDQFLGRVGKSRKDIPPGKVAEKRDKFFEAWLIKGPENEPRTRDTGVKHFERLVAEEKEKHIAFIQRKSLRMAARNIKHGVKGSTIASINTPTKDDRKRFTNSLNDLRHLYQFRENDYTQPYIAAPDDQDPRGVGKSNLAAVLVTSAIGEFAGYMTAYLPKGMKHPYKLAYEYEHAWEVFIDKPKGTSILWTVVRANELEKELGVPLPIFALWLLGEQGLGDQSKYMAQVAQNRRDIFTLGRHMRWQMIQVGAQKMSVSDQWNFVDPEVICHATDTNELDVMGKTRRNYWIELLYKNKVKKKIYDIPLSSFYKQTKKGLNLDMAGDFDQFSLTDLIHEAGLADNEKFDRDPDAAIERASNFVLELAEETLGFKYSAKRLTPPMKISESVALSEAQSRASEGSEGESSPTEPESSDGGVWD